MKLYDKIKRWIGFRRCVWCGRWTTLEVWRDIDGFCPYCYSAKEYGYNQRLREENKDRLERKIKGER